MAETSGVALHRWDDVPREVVTEGISRRFVTGERMMIAQLFLDRGSLVPLHAHENEQLTYVVEGALRFRMGADQAEEVVVRAGEVLVIPPHLPHSAEALEDTLDVDVFSPPRQDWIDKTDSYFRRK